MRTARIAARVAAELMDERAWEDLAARHVRFSRQDGLLTVLPVTLSYLACLRIHEADARVAKVVELSTLGADTLRTATALPTGWRLVFGRHYYRWQSRRRIREAVRRFGASGQAHSAHLEQLLDERNRLLEHRKPPSLSAAAMAISPARASAPACAAGSPASSPACSK